MSLIQRKIEQKVLQIKKRIIINTNGKIENPVFLNSFPKSGTHLLYQIFENFPEINKYFTFVVSMPSFFHYERSEKAIIKQINNFGFGELVRGHLFYNKKFLDALAKKKTINYFIYRDPRDIVISEANYLFDMNKYHGLHKYFKNIESLDERIKFSILGNKYITTKYDYKNINERFLQYKGWINSENVFPVKYEDLIGANKMEMLKNIIKFYCEKINCDNLENLTQKAIESINPEKSHTFREGGTRKWEKYFSEENKNIFKKIAGELLINLNYEKDLNW